MASRIWLISICFTVMSTFPVPAQAGFYSARELLAVCTAQKSDPDYFEKAYECVGYIAGAVDAFNTTREANKLKSCIPARVTISQLKAATVDYIRVKPKDGDRSASTLVFAATREKWPCPKKGVSTPRKKK